MVVETFDKKGTVLDRSVKISTLQVGQGSAVNIPDVASVNLFTSIPTKSPAARARFLVRADANQKLGAVNFALADKNPRGEESN